MIETKGYTIIEPGDESVGILGGRWDIEGGFFFEDEKEQKDFEKQLLTAFEYIADSPKLYTFEELDSMGC